MTGPPPHLTQGTARAIAPTRMSPAAFGWLVTAVACALAGISIWMTLSTADAWKSDFSFTYIGATLWREGMNPYSLANQAMVHSRLTHSVVTMVVPFAAAPLAAVVAVPTTFLSLPVAYRLAGVVTYLLLLLGVILATHSVPGASWKRTAAIAACVVGLPPSWELLFLGQWDGVAAAGIGAALWLRSRNHPVWSGWILVVTSGIAKPHLVVGVCLFVLMAKDRRWGLGVLTGAVTIALATVGIAGTTATWGFVHSLTYQATTYSSSFTLIVGWLLLPTHISLATRITFATVVSLAVLALAGLGLGWIGRRESAPELPLFAAALGVSVLFAPHLYPCDLVLPAIPLGALAVSRWDDVVSHVNRWWSLWLLALVLGAVIDTSAVGRNGGLDIGAAIAAVIAVMTARRALGHPPSSKTASAP